jgi:hypothetical protein
MVGAIMNIKIFLIKVISSNINMVVEQQQKWNCVNFKLEDLFSFTD